MAVNQHDEIDEHQRLRDAVVEAAKAWVSDDLDSGDCLINATHDLLRFEREGEIRGS